jgi:ribosome-binding protein aMBF1 (putative translation factor)
MTDFPSGILVTRESLPREPSEWSCQDVGQCVGQGQGRRVVVNAGESVGAVIRRARQAHGWSQARFAEQLNAVSGRCTTTRQDVDRWEAGRRPPTRS